MKKLFVSSLGASILFASAVLAETPPWYSDSSAGGKYPPAQYLVGIGTGKTLKDAESEAKRVLAESFRSEIKGAVDQKKTSEMSQDTAGKVEGRDQSNTTSDLSIKSEMLLRGVEIKERAMDKNEHYALAVLNRGKAKLLYMQDLNKGKARIDALASKLEKKAKNSDLKSLQAELTTFDRLNEEYAILAGGMGMPRPISEDRVEIYKGQIESASEGVRIDLQLEGERKDLEDSIAECMVERKIKVVEAAGNPTHTLTMTFTEKEEPISVKGWLKFRYQLSGRLRSEAKSFQRFSVRRVEQGRNAEQAYYAAKDAVSEQVCIEVEKAVLK